MAKENEGTATPVIRSAKYESTGKTIEFAGRVLHQIRRIKDGLIGGWIECERNLDTYGDAWVSGDAQVYGNARVSGDARVSGNAQVYGDARVSGDAWVSGNAQVATQLDYLHIAGLSWPVTMCNDGLMSIGCQTKPLSVWLATEFGQHEKVRDQAEFTSIRATLVPIVTAFAAHHSIALTDLTATGGQII